MPGDDNDDAPPSEQEESVQYDKTPLDQVDEKVQEEEKEIVAETPFEEVKLPPIDNRFAQQDSEELARQLQAQYDAEQQRAAADEEFNNQMVQEDLEGRDRRRKSKKGRRR